MLNLNQAHTFRVCLRPTDMRKGFDSLCGLVRNVFGGNPYSGEVFVFINRPRTTIKLLHWEHGGFVLYHKRLERGTFEQFANMEGLGHYQLSWTQLVLLMEGISISETRKRVRFGNV